MSPPAGFGTKLLGPDGSGAPPGPAPTPGMSLWVKGGAGLFTSPGVWSDQSGNGYDLIGPGGGGNPTAGAGINGFPTAEFNGSSQYLETAIGVTLAQLVTANVFSIFIVAKYTGFNDKLGNLFTPPTIIDSGGNLGVFSHYHGGNGRIWGSTTAGANNGLISGTFTAADPKRMSFIQAGIAVAGNQQSLTYSGGAPVVEDGVAIGSVASRLCVGFWAGTGATYFQGSIGEILLYPFALSGPQQTATEAYLDGAWGL